MSMTKATKCMVQASRAVVVGCSGQSATRHRIILRPWGMVSNTPAASQRVA